MFLPKRLCRMLPNALGALGANDVVENAMPEGIEGLTSEMPAIRPVTWERILTEFETHDNLRHLQEEIIMQESRMERSDLLMRLLRNSTDSEGNQQTREVIDLLLQSDQTSGIEQAESMVREYKMNNKEEYNRRIAEYQRDPQVIRERLLAGEIQEEEAHALLQEELKKHPTITKFAEELGIDIATASAMLAGAFAKTGKIPQSTTEFLSALRDGAQGLMSFRVVERSAKALNIPPASLRSVYGVSVGDFASVIDECVPLRDNKMALEELLTGERSASERRIIKKFIDSPYQEIQPLIKLRDTIREQEDKVLAELDKTFANKLKEEGAPAPQAHAVRASSLEYYQKHLTVGKMMTILYSEKEDRETLLSYTYASLLATLPKGINAIGRLGGLNRLLGNPTALNNFVESFRGQNMSRLGGARFLSSAVEAERLRHGGVASSVAEGAVHHQKMGRNVSRMGGMGRMLRFAGIGGLAATEVYNMNTGRSNLAQSAGRFAGGMLRFVPVVGTGLDFSEAFGGKDYINGQSLNAGERMSRVGWGIVGLISDVTMFIPVLGVGIKGAVLSARGAAIARGARVMRRTAMVGGIGVGVAPMLASEQGREAVGAAGSVAAGTATASLGLLRMLGGAGDAASAADLMVAQDEMQENIAQFTRDTAEGAGEAISSAAETVGDVAAEGFEAVRSRLEDLIGSWDSGARANLMESASQMNTEDRDALLGALDNTERSRGLQEIAQRTGLSHDERERQFLDFLRQGGNSMN